MKHNRADVAILAAILLTATAITAAFLFCDNAQPHYKNNTKYQFSLPEFSQEPSAQASGGVQIVYLSASGTKYHSDAQCPALSRSKVVRSVDLNKALLLGKEPCTRCH